MFVIYFYAYQFSLSDHELLIFFMHIIIAHAVISHIYIFFFFGKGQGKRVFGSPDGM